MSVAAEPQILFDLADPARAGDDRALRSLVATNPVPGRVTLSFEREPNFFAGCAALGAECQVIVGREQATGRIAGLTCRAVRTVFVNGEPHPLGYLGQLRIDAAFRGRWLIARGFRFLRQLERTSPVDGYLATITDENRQAIGLLVEHRRNTLPVFDEIAELHTLALFVRGRGTPRGGAERADFAEVACFLDEHGRRRQFFPVYTPADFLRLGVDPADVLVDRGARGAVRGVLAVWDQSATRQAVVRGYDPMLVRLRPLVNAVARVAGMRRPPLPAVGQPLATAYASFVCVADEDPRVFANLLARAYALAAARGFSYLALGLPAQDPFLKVARRYPHLTYRSRVYLATWSESDLQTRLDRSRLPYVELGSL